jgi:CRISPR system Cascade subunit CasA
VGLGEVLLRGHELTDIEVPVAPAAAGLWRVLYLLAARVSGLDDEDLSPAEFDEAREEVLGGPGLSPEKIAKYFDDHRGRFGLFDGDRPWLQDPRLAGECSSTSGVNKLVLGRPAGSNQVWFDHHTELKVEPLPAAEAAWYLLAGLYYGPSGRCTTRTVGRVSEANSMAGPLRGSLSCHPVGRTLFESLVLGIPTPSAADVHVAAGAIDAAPWEAATLPDPLNPPRLRGLAGALTGRFHHAVLLVPDGAGRNVIDATLTWSRREKSPQAADPYLVYQVSKKGDPYPRQASGERALWRDLDALLRTSVGEEQRSHPQIFAALKYVPQEFVADARVRVFGFDQDGQTRDKQTFIQETPPVLGWLEERDPAFAAGISAVRVAGEQIGANLRRALKLAWARLADPNDDGLAPAKGGQGEGPWVAAAESRYWPRAEREFWRILDSGDFTDPGSGFARLAEAIYDELVDQVNKPAHWRMTRALTRERYRIRRGTAAARTKESV